MKKVIAMILVFAMLVPLSSAVAADEMSAKPTVEEILDEYHRKAFEREMQGDTETASTWSRQGGSAKTLEEETVETLTNAGYEAYNVTAENYDALEAQLYTDFGEMGLDPNGSYIVVISGGDGESCASTPNSNSRISPEIDFEGPPSGTSGLPSTYTLNGVTYDLRYLTVTAADNANQFVSSTYTLKDEGFIPESWEEIGSFCLVGALDSITVIPFASVATLINDVYTDSNYTLMNPGDLTVHASTTWVRHYIQVSNETYGTWRSTQCSEYAKIRGYLSCYVYNASIDNGERFIGDEVVRTEYSPFYYDMDTRIFDAVNAFFYNQSIDHDKIDIDFHFDNDNLTSSGGRYLFTHYSPSC